MKISTLTVSSHFLKSCSLGRYQRRLCGITKTSEADQETFFRYKWKRIQLAYQFHMIQNSSQQSNNVLRDVVPQYFIFFYIGVVPPLGKSSCRFLCQVPIFYDLFCGKEKMSEVCECRFLFFFKLNVILLKKEFLFVVFPSFCITFLW